MKITNPSTDDQTLLDLLRDGDHAAFGAIYSRYLESVLRTAYAVVGSAHLADDIAQEVFLSLWRRPEMVQLSRGTLGAFLRTLAHHRAVDLVRVEQRRRERCVAAGSTWALDGEGPAEPDICDAVTSELEVVEREAAVRSALEGLPESQRRAVDLAFFGGRTYRAVSNELGVPEGTVKTRIRAAMTRLRSCQELAALAAA